MRRDTTPTMALFCDFENVALGVRDRKQPFDAQIVIERLLSRGSIVVKKAYADWNRYREYVKEMHRANFELIEVPATSQSGKNSADIRMVVDALDLCYTKEHVSTFVLITGDSDFSPLVSKLRENNKTVIGVGVRNATSDLLMSNCDEFLFYDDLAIEARAKRPAKNADGTETEAHAEAPAKSARGKGGSRRGGKAKVAKAEEPVEKVAAAEPAPKAKSGRTTTRHAEAQTETQAAPAETVEGATAPDLHATFDLMLETLEAVFSDRGENETVWASMLKQSLKRRRPEFNERHYGFRTFGDMLEAARNQGLVEIEKDDKSGNYRILGFGPNG